MATGIAQKSCTALSAYQGKKVSFRLVLKQMRFYGLQCLDSSEATIQMCCLKQLSQKVLKVLDKHF